MDDLLAKLFPSLFHFSLVMEVVLVIQKMTHIHRIFKFCLHATVVPNKNKRSQSNNLIPLMYSSDYTKKLSAEIIYSMYGPQMEISYLIFYKLVS